MFQVSTVVSKLICTLYILLLWTQATACSFCNIYVFELIPTPVNSNYPSYTLELSLGLLDIREISKTRKVENEKSEKTILFGRGAGAIVTYSRPVSYKILIF